MVRDEAALGELRIRISRTPAGDSGFNLGE
jgi:hypothetical protein